MTPEQRIFLPFGDIVALEFRCKVCDSTVRRPLETWRQPPAACGNCGAQWVTDGSARHQFLNRAVELFKTLAASDDEAKYVLRAEIKAEGLPAKGQVIDAAT
jgi:hypothetical protein